ncbi:MAG: IPT/TIG domain-containing protein [Acidobacteriota bacterium]
MREERRTHGYTSGARTGALRVVVSGQNSNPWDFIVLPANGNVEPTSGPASGGTRVTILAPAGTSGTQFNVLFGSTVAREIQFMQPNIITCDSPPGTGTVDVKVTSSVTSTTVGTFSYR